MDHPITIHGVIVHTMTIYGAVVHTITIHGVLLHTITIHGVMVRIITIYGVMVRIVTMYGVPVHTMTMYGVMARIVTSYGVMVHTMMTCTMSTCVIVLPPMGDMTISSDSGACGRRVLRPHGSSALGPGLGSTVSVSVNHQPSVRQGAYKNRGPPNAGSHLQTRRCEAGVIPGPTPTPLCISD